MDFSIRHAIAGRLRLHVPALYQRSSFTDALIAWLRNQVGIKSARINHYCASLVIEYDRQKSTTLTTLLFHLRYASIDQVRAIVSPPDPVRADTAFVSNSGNTRRRAHSVDVTLAVAVADRLAGAGSLGASVGDRLECANDDLEWLTADQARLGRLELRAAT